jgi:peptidyl-prolyl cis-trans isomerase-like 4
MSVIIETSVGTLTIDLFVDDCPIACKNFLKLCKLKYYNNCIFHNIQKDFLVQTGDPTATGRGGESVYGLLYGEQAKFFKDEIKPYLKHRELGMVAMANRGSDQNASQFFITTGENLESLDGKHTIFGQVEEGLETLSKIDNALCDKDGRPLQVIRIRHTILLDDPYPDLAGMAIPEKSPPPVIDAPKGLLPEFVSTKVDQEMTAEDQEKRKKELEKQQSRSRAQILVELGDIPDADIKPPDDVLFVCRLNPITSEDDLKIIFGRFGNIDDCEIIRDKLTGDSLCYAFIKYDTEESAIEAYFKMNKVLIDERRIHVDFSQSVAKVDWQNSRKLLKAGGVKPEKKERNNNSYNNNNRNRDLRDETNDKKRKREFDRDEKPKYAKEETRNRESYRDRDSHRDRDRDNRDTRERDSNYVKSENRDRREYDRDEKPKYVKEENRDRESYKDRDSNRDSKYVKEESRDRDSHRDRDRDQKSSYEKEESRDRDRDRRSERKYEDKYDDRKRY